MNIEGNHFEAPWGFTVTCSCIYLRGLGSAQYTDDIVVADNSFNVTSNGGTVVAVELGTNVGAGNSRIRIEHRDVNLSGPGAQRLVLPDETLNNPNIRVFDRRGESATPVDRVAAHTAWSPTDPDTILYATALTSPWTVSLASVDVYPGREVMLLRTATGPYTIDFAGMASLSAPGWAKVRRTQTGWVLIGKGDL
jgi:hypothetical protein